MTQLQHYWSSARKIADQNEAFMEMVNHPTNPLTNADLIASIKRRPEKYKRFEGFLGKLKGGENYAEREANG